MGEEREAEASRKGEQKEEEKVKTRSGKCNYSLEEMRGRPISGRTCQTLRPSGS